MSDSTPRGKKARKTSKEAASQERARVKDEKAEARSLKLQLLADTSQSDDHALREACFNGEDEAAARIIRRQPSLVTEVDEDGLSLLGIALLKANVGCVRLLLENGADPNIAKGGGGGGSSRGDSELNTLDAALRCPPTLTTQLRCVPTPGPIVQRMCVCAVTTSQTVPVCSTPVGPKVA